MEKINGKRITIYDRGEKTFDRFTCIHWHTPYKDRFGCVYYFARGMSDDPFHPQGFGESFEWGKYQDTRANGKTIKFSDCPIDVQNCILQDMQDED